MMRIVGVTPSTPASGDANSLHIPGFAGLNAASIFCPFGENALMNREILDLLVRKTPKREKKAAKWKRVAFGASLLSLKRYGIP